MTSKPRPSRRYSDEEVQRLLSRAADLETQGGSLPARATGPTLDDIEAIASEAGINPAMIRQAALELDSSSGFAPSQPNSWGGFLGAPTAFELERTVAGEASQTTLERLVPELQRASDGVGQPSLLGKTLTWVSQDSSKTRTLQVTVTAGRGETRLIIEERYGALAGSLFGGIMGGGGTGLGLGVGFGVGLGALGSVAFAALFPVGIMTGAWALSRGIFRHTVFGRTKKLTRLMDELVATIEDGVQLALEDGQS